MCPQQWAGAVLTGTAPPPTRNPNVPECCVGRAAAGPGSKGLPECLSVLDHFSQGKPIKETIPPLCLHDTLVRPAPPLAQYLGDAAPRPGWLYSNTHML